MLPLTEIGRDGIAPKPSPCKTVLQGRYPDAPFPWPCRGHGQGTESTYRGRKVTKDDGGCSSESTEYRSRAPGQRQGSARCRTAYDGASMNAIDVHGHFGTYDRGL